MPFIDDPVLRELWAPQPTTIPTWIPRVDRGRKVGRGPSVGGYHSNCFVRGLIDPTELPQKEDK